MGLISLTNFSLSCSHLTIKSIQIICYLNGFLMRNALSITKVPSQQGERFLCAICCQLLWKIPRGIEKVSVCTGLLDKEGSVNMSVDTRL